MAKLEFQTDEEEQKDQAELREGREDFRECRAREGIRHMFQVRLEHPLKRIWEQRTKERWPHDDARNDFADHGGLPESAEEQAEATSHEHDDNQLHEDRQQQRFDIEFAECGDGTGEVVRGIGK